MMDGYCFYDITIHLNRQAETGLIHCEIKLLAEIIGVLGAWCLVFFQQIRSYTHPETRKDCCCNKFKIMT